MSDDRIKQSAERGAVVVTGVSSGIGEALAKHLCEQGYRVYGSVRKEEDAQPLVRMLGDAFKPLIFDVTDRDGVARGAEFVTADIGEKPLQALVNNAGLGLLGPLEHLDDHKFEQVIAVNVFGTRLVSNAFIPLLKARTDAHSGLGSYPTRPGKMINISSLSGILNTPMLGAYCVSKHAMESLGETYRRELLPHGIDVVSIRSGPIQSKIWQKNAQEPGCFDDKNYSVMLDHTRKIMRDGSATALRAVVVAQLVVDIIQGKKKSVAYEIGQGALISRILSRYVPTRLADRLITNSMLKADKKR